jgi:gentisate 1,2-dioxygenase
VDIRSPRLFRSNLAETSALRQTGAMSADANVASPERKAFYARIRRHNLAPLWEYANPTSPRTPAVPALWRWDEVRPHLMESGRLISKAEAHRRVLVLENPAMAGAQAATRTLYAGLQLIFPGEIAPNHRHAQSALRFLLEGEGAYTAVGGERSFMRPGDFVVTPSWSWHDHGNEGTGPAIWMDVLDSPLVAFLGAEFRENAPEGVQPQRRPSGDSRARFGSGLLPVGHKAERRASPLLNYPYAESRAALERLRRAGEWDPCHGLALQYVNPATGGPAMPSIATFLQLLPKGFAGAPYRSTDGAIFAVAEGTGASVVGDAEFAWGPRDIFVVPSWCRASHRADTDAVLFSASDRPVHEALDLWREERGNLGPAA